MSDEKPEESPPSPEVHFEPVIRLPEVELKTFEEEEEELLKLRAKLYRYSSNEKPPEWKERGTGDVKLLLHKDKGAVRLVMRRDKTLKLCANHYVTPWMELKPNCGSDKAWVWSVPADFADEEPKPELLAIKFGNAENAKKFYDKFEESKKIVLENGDAEFAKKLALLGVKDESDSEDDEEADSSVDKSKTEPEEGSEKSKKAEEGSEKSKEADEEPEPSPEETTAKPEITE